jgi:hypothetical protein
MLHSDNDSMELISEEKIHHGWKTYLVGLAGGRLKEAQGYKPAFIRNPIQHLHRVGHLPETPKTVTT